MSFSSKYTLDESVRQYFSQTKTKRPKQIKEYLLAAMRGEAPKGKTYWAWWMMAVHKELLDGHKMRQMLWNAMIEFRKVDWLALMNEK